MTPHEVLLKSSDMPRRLDDARALHAYDVAMGMPAPMPPAIALWFAVIMLGACTVFPFVGLAVAPNPPVWLFFVMIGLAAIPAVLLRSVWRRFHEMRDGLVRRELFAVIDREVVRFNNNRRWYLTLWNREASFARHELVIGEPHIGIGDVGLAVFRGKFLVNVIKLPVKWEPLPA